MGEETKTYRWMLRSGESWIF